jgi:protein-tyrosine phosphatase
MKKTNVLVHCQAGVSRSVTIVAAYLMKENRIDYVSSLDLIRSKRPQICPNKGFLKQLKQY